MNAMKTPVVSPCFPAAAAIVLAALIYFPASSSAQTAVGIYGGVIAPEYCPPNADCVSLRFELRRTGPGLEQPLTVRVLFGGTAAYAIDYGIFPGTVTFAAFQDRVSISSNPIDDNVYEGDETVEARLMPGNIAAPGSYAIDPAHAVATDIIRDNDPERFPPVVSLELVDGSATETLSGQNFADWAEFRVTRSGTAVGALDVYLGFEGTAQLDVDYELDRLGEGRTVRLPAGLASLNVRLYVIDDAFLEGEEKVLVHVIPTPPGIVGYDVDPEHASIAMAIRDNESPTAPIVSIRATQPFTAEPCPTCLVAPGVFTISRTGPTTSSLRVFLTARGTATPEHDYVPLPSSVEIPADQESVQVLVLPKDDLLVEGDETVIATLEPDSTLPMEDYRVDPEHSQDTVVIRDDDPGFVPVVSLTAPQPGTSECPAGLACDIGPGVFLLTRTGPGLDNALTVFLRYTGTASPGLDYGALPETATFEPGQDAVRLLVVAVDDNLIEGTEVVVAELLPDPSLGPVPRYRVDSAHAEAKVTIEDGLNPVLPVVSIRATRPETQEPLCPPDTCLAPTPAPGVFTLSRRGGDPNRAVTVLLRYGGSALPRADYDPLSESVEIPAGLESVELFVSARFDEAVEGDESVLAALLPDPSMGPVGWYRIDPAQATARVVIHDRTPPAVPFVSIVATDPFAREGANSSAGLNTATFIVRRTGETTSDLDVPLDIRGTASNGVDYETIPGHVTIPAGSRSAQIVVTPIDDNLREKTETVIIGLHDPSVPGGIFPGPSTYLASGPRRAAAIIVDNDRPRPPCLRLSDGLFNVCLPASDVECVRVECTRDFKEWTPLCTVPVNEGMAHFIDPDAPDAPHKFFRLVPVVCEP